MIHRRPLTLFCLLAVSLQALVSCAFQPAIDPSGEVAVRQPCALVQKHADWQFERFKRNKHISQDPRYTEPVQRVARRLKQVIDMPNAEWEFVIFEDNSPNAFALSGGKVGINTGLFRIADNDAMLAAVLGHEISHASANHAERRMLRAAGTVALGAVLWAVLDHNEVEQPGYALGAYVLAAYIADSLPFSRKQEYESDKIGTIYMAKAGYDPHQAIELWHKMEYYHNQQDKKPKPEFVRTHPLDSSRIKALEAFMPVAMQHYQPWSPAKK